MVAGPGNDHCDEAAVKSAVLRNATSSVFTQTKQGNLGACATADKKAEEGRHLAQRVDESGIAMRFFSTASRRGRTVECFGRP